jgi:hypothetical protein
MNDCVRIGGQDNKAATTPSLHTCAGAGILFPIDPTTTCRAPPPLETRITNQESDAVSLTGETRISGVMGVYA